MLTIVNQQIDVLESYVYTNLTEPLDNENYFLIQLDTWSDIVFVNHLVSHKKQILQIMAKLPIMKFDSFESDFQKIREQILDILK